MLKILWKTVSGERYNGLHEDIVMREQPKTFNI